MECFNAVEGSLYVCGKGRWWGKGNCHTWKAVSHSLVRTVGEYVHSASDKAETLIWVFFFFFNFTFSDTHMPEKKTE